jgi:hypothetical protein
MKSTERERQENKMRSDREYELNKKVRDTVLGTFKLVDRDNENMRKPKQKDYMYGNPIGVYDDEDDY